MGDSMVSPEMLPHRRGRSIEFVMLAGGSRPQAFGFGLRALGRITLSRGASVTRPRAQSPEPRAESLRQSAGPFNDVVNSMFPQTIMLNRKAGNPRTMKR
jgi:hypothetical protein